MAAQKKEETETEQLKNMIPICIPPQTKTITTAPPQIPIRSPDTSDNRTTSSAGPPDPSKTLKRPRGEATRCSGSGCRRRVGLVGFRCRCGEVFCSEHRYSDRHDCSYDYKAAGREAIARDNPVVRASKLLKV